MTAIDIAGAILSRAMQRVDVSAQNLANLTTPGYKARTAFASLVTDDIPPARDIDFANGKIRVTGNPLDLAISGEGFFAVSAGGSTYYTRNGQFARDEDGRIVTLEGLALQSDNGDVVAGQAVTVLEDGTVLDGQEPIGRLRIVKFDDVHALQPTGAGLFMADAPAKEVTIPQVRQGMLETSNVTAADEMTAVMAALRNAETGQRLVQTFDDLMGKATATFGQV